MSANDSTREYQEDIVSNMIVKQSKHTHYSTSKKERFLQRRLARLYDITKPELCFYAQDPSGYPSNPPEAISTTMKGETFYPQVLRDNVVDQERGLKNKTVEEMLGHPSWRVQCQNCYQSDPDSEISCTCDYQTWAEEQFNFWIGNINIQKSPGKGFCLFARKTIPAHSTIGEYCGELVNSAWRATAKESAYWVSTYCGMPREDKKGGQKLCRVDASKKGSPMRFMSHSCKPNAYLVRGRIGDDRYVVAVKSLEEEIQPGQEITIDYGKGWFKKGEFCLCGHAECRKPPLEDV
ncbi:SET domain-containing protein [Periconia macrospinosa]|uniref:SET domain-containing protein n=1 Tax=Periconia macrospinosa TaxID=97972 RepID=A0A2V1E4J1_9PLEO|nr:SET domain-containing protein [Periconia macrospinosa]